MNPSLFLAWVQAYFPKLILQVVEKYNGRDSQYPFYYRQYLRKVFSGDGKWATMSVNNTLVAADLVAMDSSLPLKKRPSIGQYSGDIPKLGLEFAMNEKELSDLQTLLARLNYNNSASIDEIIARIFRDVDRIIGGMYERIDIMFLQAISTGATVVSEGETTGTAVRLNYNFPAANTIGSTQSWDDATNAKPITDLNRQFNAMRRNGVTPRLVMMDYQTLVNAASTNEGRQLYAEGLGFVGSAFPQPTNDQFIGALNRKFPNIRFDVIDKIARIEKNGVQVAVNPWQPGKVVISPSTELGSLTWTRLAEMDYRAPGVEYQTVDDFILVSKFNENRPTLREVTNGQGRAVPVIDNPTDIYSIDTNIDNG